MNYLKINRNISNIINDYLLPNKKEIDFNKLKMVKSIDFEYIFYGDPESEYQNFKDYLNQLVKNNPININFYFNEKSKSWVSKSGNDNYHLDIEPE